MDMVIVRAWADLASDQFFIGINRIAIQTVFGLGFRV